MNNQSIKMASRLVQQDIQSYFLYKSGEHHMYGIPAVKLMSLAEEGILKVWSGNRPADMERVNEIREQHIVSQHVDGTIRLAFIHSVGLVCYEGNHRRMALIPEIECILVDILWNVSNERVIQEFMLVNKAVSVPEIYTELDMDATEKNKLAKYVSDLCMKYKAYVSTSPRPNRPQFNRDTFTQDLTTMWKKFNCSAETLIQGIEALNEAYKNETIGDHTRIKSTRILDKCSVGGFWLFAYDTQLNSTHLEKVLLIKMD